MNLTAIILFFIILIALYFLFRYFYTRTLIEDVVSLNISAGAKPYEIASTSLDTPASVRYYYSFWVYIETNVPADTKNIIFRRGKDFILYLKGRSLVLAKTNTLGDNVFTNGVYTESGKDVLTIIENAPFQKWTHVVISVDNQNVDSYIDGKLAQSKEKSGMLITDTTPSILIGNIHTVGKITRFDRVAGMVSPSEVMSIYARGSGQSTTGNKYKADVALTYNDIVQNKWRIV